MNTTIAWIAIVASFVGNGWLLWLLFLEHEKRRTQESVMDRLTAQVHRRDFLIKELREIADDINEQDNYPHAGECPRCQEVALIGDEVVNGKMQYNCKECGHFEY